jgi:hypothetical protein
MEKSHYAEKRGVVEVTAVAVTLHPRPTQAAPTLAVLTIRRHIQATRTARRRILAALAPQVTLCLWFTLPARLEACPEIRHKRVKLQEAAGIIP